MTNPESSVFPEPQPTNPMLQVLSSYIVRILEIPANRRSVYDTVRLAHLRLAVKNEIFKTLYRQEPQPGAQQMEVKAQPRLQANELGNVDKHLEVLALSADQTTPLPGPALDQTEPLPLRIVA